MENGSPWKKLLWKGGGGGVAFEWKGLAPSFQTLAEKTNKQHEIVQSEIVVTN